MVTRLSDYRRRKRLNETDFVYFGSLIRNLNFWGIIITEALNKCRSFFKLRHIRNLLPKLKQAVVQVILVGIDQIRMLANNLNSHG